MQTPVSSPFCVEHGKVYSRVEGQMLSDAEVILGIERQLMTSIFFLRVCEMDGSVNLDLSSVDFPVHSRHTLRDEGVPEIFSTEFNKVFWGRGIVKVRPDSEITYSGVVVEVVAAGGLHAEVQSDGSAQRV